MCLRHNVVVGLTKPRELWSPARAGSQAPPKGSRHLTLALCYALKSTAIGDSPCIYGFGSRPSSIIKKSCCYYIGIIIEIIIEFNRVVINNKAIPVTIICCIHTTIGLTSLTDEVTSSKSSIIDTWATCVTCYHNVDTKPVHSTGTGYEWVKLQ